MGRPRKEPPAPARVGELATLLGIGRAAVLVALERAGIDVGPGGAVPAPLPPSAWQHLLAAGAKSVPEKMCSRSVVAAPE